MTLRIILLIIFLQAPLEHLLPRYLDPQLQQLMMKELALRDQKSHSHCFQTPDSHFEVSSADFRFLHQHLFLQRYFLFCFLIFQHPSIFEAYRQKFRSRHPLKLLQRWEDANCFDQPPLQVVNRNEVHLSFVFHF